LKQIPMQLRTAIEALNTDKTTTYTLNTQPKHGQQPSLKAMIITYKLPFMREGQLHPNTATISSSALNPQPTAMINRNDHQPLTSTTAYHAPASPPSSATSTHLDRPPP
jgi:hypothetical protein